MTTPEGYAAPKRRVGIGAAIVGVILAVVVTVGLGLWRTADTPVQTVPVGGGERGAAAVEPSPVYVHVSGAVRLPGLYRLHDGARVVDAVAAAGGLADDAVPSGVNLARPVSDGEQLVVPREGEAGPDAAGPADDRVNLNSASMAELETLPRIGPALAQRIIDWRDANGRFTSVEDLLAVPGIGEKMMSALQPLVRI
ncbi:MAG: ComEA family DNA-binding protein [Microbacterium sp.]|uniref:ComEA family DNA-binding protein n=1 Tax=Microbacterium sp. TaxID=51671 RepID=UPI003A84A606